MSNQRKIVCLPCKGKGYFDTDIALLYCNWCKGTGSINQQIYDFTLDELKALYRIFEHQYVDYSDEEAHTVVNKICKYVSGVK